MTATPEGEGPIETPPVTDPRPWSWVARALIRGTVAAGCVFSLGAAFFPRHLVHHVAFGESKEAFRAEWYVGVRWWTQLAFLAGAFAGQIKVGPKLKWTSIGAMFGGLVGVIVADLTDDPKEVALMLIFILGVIVGAIGFLAGGFVAPEATDPVEARPRWSDRPPLWDREMDG